MQISLYSIAIFVSDIERAKTFYRDTLEWPVSKEGSFGAEFFPEGAHVGVHPATHPEARKMVGRETGITLHVDGLLHYCGVLMDRGVRFVREPTQQSFGVMALIADPDGNVIALWDDKTPDSSTATVASH